MAINPNLLVIKPVNELESVTGLQAGQILFYDGSNNLKKIDVDTFNNLSKTAKPLKPTDATPTVEGLYMPTESGTYNNADGLIAQEGYYTLFFFDGTNWTKSETKLPENSVKIPIWSATDFDANAQTIRDNIIYIAPNGANASDIPGESDVWISLGAQVSPVFNPETTTESQGGKQIVDFLIQNNLGQITQETVNSSDFPQGGYTNEAGNVVGLAGFQFYILNNAQNINKVILNGTTKSTGEAPKTLLGMRTSDSVVEVIFDEANQTLTNKVILIERNKYHNLYFNIKNGAASITINRVITDIPIFADPNDFENVQNKQEEVDKVLNFFLKKTDTPTDIITSFAQGGYTQNGNTYPLAGYDFLYEYKADFIYKAELTMLTREPQYLMPTLYGKLKDGTFETIYDSSNTELTDFPVNIDEGRYVYIYANMRNSGTHKIKFYKRTEILDLKDYGDKNWGSAKELSSQIMAINHGVSPVNTAEENTRALNSLLAINQSRGVPIYLPAGEILINGTLQYGSRNRLFGASWGGQNTEGTRLKATTSAPMINVFAVNPTSDIQDGQIQNIALDGNNIATKCMTIGELVAYFDMERIEFRRPTDVGLETVGALIYTLQRCRFMQVANGVRTRRTSGVQANLIKFTDVQFILNSGISCDIADGAQVVFNDCDWENVGTAGNANTGAIKVRNMSPLGEGCDVTINNAWSEYINGGFFLDIANSGGTSVIRDSMLWKLTGDASVGVKNNGSKLLIDGSTKINDFTTNILTTNGGETRIGGFANIGSTSENSGGVKKTLNWN